MHLKILAVLFGAVLSMAFASSASAAVLTSPAGTAYTGSLEATAVETFVSKDGFATLTCTGATIGGKVESNTESAASGKISTLSFTGCSGTTDVLSKGSLEIRSGGEVRAIGSEVTTFIFGTTCVYGGGTGTKLGTLTGGTTATLTVKAQMPKISGGLACANPSELTGKFSITTPNTLLVD